MYTFLIHLSAMMELYHGKKSFTRESKCNLFLRFGCYDEPVHARKIGKDFQMSTFSWHLTATMVSKEEVTAVCGTTDQQLPRGKIQRGYITSCLAQRINRSWLQMNEISRINFEPVGSRASPGTPEAVR